MYNINVIVKHTSWFRTAKPHQVLLCQYSADLSRIPGARHHCAAAVNYCSVGGGGGVRMLTAKECIMWHRITVMQCG